MKILEKQVRFREYVYSETLLKYGPDNRATVRAEIAYRDIKTARANLEQCNRRGLKLSVKTLTRDPIAYAVHLAHEGRSVHLLNGSTDDDRRDVQIKALASLQWDRADIIDFLSKENV